MTLVLPQTPATERRLEKLRLVAIAVMLVLMLVLRRQTLLHRRRGRQMHPAALYLTRFKRQQGYSATLRLSCFLQSVITCTCNDAWILTPVAHLTCVNFARLPVRMRNRL